MKKSNIWKISKEEFKNRILKSDSVGELLETFNLKNKGANYKTINQRCFEENLLSELDELKKRGKRKNKFLAGKLTKETPLEEMLIENSKNSRANLKRRLLKEKLIKNECSICGLKDFWNNIPIVLILDHINGIPDDNRLENLRLVCPNCNSQLDTFAGRHVKRNKKSCIICKNEVDSKYKKYCLTCKIEANENKKKFIISKTDLEKLIWSKPMIELAKLFNVSDVTISKKCVSLGIEKPPRGYWSRNLVLGEIK